MELIRQQTDWDCSYACVAMVCGVTLEDVIKVTSYGSAMYEDEMLRTIAHFQHLPTQVQGDVLYIERNHIVCVPSLNFPGLNHSIVLCTGKEGDPISIYDPQEGKEGKKWYNDELLKCWSRVLWVKDCRSL
jgi:ABC-type bacteriocin/lantibiotic exporter with double-glycine peptidase domain